MVLGKEKSPWMMTAGRDTRNLGLTRIRFSQGCWTGLLKKGGFLTIKGRKVERSGANGRGNARLGE